MAKHKNFNCL